LDGGISKCVDPEGNRVNTGKGAGGGAGPPSEGLDKQLNSDSGGGDETSMGEPGRQQDKSDVAPKTHHAQST
jgi:hypothetical protein